MSPACRASIAAIPPVWWLRGRGSGHWGRGSGQCGAHSADHLGERHWQWGNTAEAAEAVCVVGTTAPGHAWSTREPLNMRVNPLDTHVNLSKYAWAALPAHKSAGPRTSQRAHARGVGPRRESAGPGAHERARVRAGARGEAARRSGGGVAGSRAKCRVHVRVAGAHPRSGFACNSIE